MRDYEYFGATYDQDGPVVEFVEHAPGDLANPGELSAKKARANIGKRAGALGAASKALVAVTGIAALGMGLLFSGIASTSNTSGPTSSTSQNVSFGGGEGSDD